MPTGVYALFTQPTLESEPETVQVAKGAKITQSGYPSIFYPEAREFSGAARIRLKAGDQAEANLLLTLEPFYTVKATAILPNGKQANSYQVAERTPYSVNPTFFVLDVSEHPLDYPAQFDAENHSFQVSLPDGTYSLLANILQQAENSSVLASSAEKPTAMQQLLSGLTEFSVDGHAVANLRIPLSHFPGCPIHLRVLRTAAQSGTNSTQLTQNLVTITATNAGEPAKDNLGGELTVEAAGPELLELYGAHFSPHWISTQVNDRGLCLDSFSAGGINLAREPLNLAPGASPPPMELTLRDDCAKLALTLPPALADFLPGEEPFYTVYVVPDFDTTADIPPMTVHPSSGATLTVDGLTPGSYHVYRLQRAGAAGISQPGGDGRSAYAGAAGDALAGETGNLMLEVPER